ncbi:MAG: orotate phosphoribosyltransferase [Opitutales bacterium]
MADPDPRAQEALSLFRASRALLEGHFVLRSGLHSGHFFQCAQVCQYPDKVTRLAELLIEGGPVPECTTVVSPAMGGLVIGQEVARQLSKRFVFLEKVEGRLALRRGFTFEAGEPVLVVEDVITQGGRVDETLAILDGLGVRTQAVWVLVDRSGGETRFRVPHRSLVSLAFPTYPADEVPPELAAVPVTQPGS